MVQVVRDIVAVAALVEFGHHSGRMRRAVTVGTFRDHLVLCLVAESAGEGLVFCGTCGKQIERLFMACAAVFGRHIGCVGDDLRHVWLMATLAVGVHHVGRVRLVALQAFRDLAVNTVACGAAKGSMLTFILPKLSDLLGMAGKAGLCYVWSEADLQRRVGVLVAAQTPFDFEMRFAHMALAAFRYIVFRCRSVPRVAILAGNVLVFSSIGCYCRRWSGVTLDTIVV